MQTFSIMAAPAPQLLRDYLTYMSTIKGRSPRTVEAYYNDLRLFLRYLMATRSGTPLPLSLIHILSATQALYACYGRCL